jgi:hypothetical protein
MSLSYEMIELFEHARAITITLCVIVLTFSDHHVVHFKLL